MLNVFQKKAILRATTKSQSRTYAGAADLKVLQRRQKTVTQIGKICGVLKVVAQSRLLIAQEKAANVTAFFESMQKVFDPVAKRIMDKEGDRDIVTIVIYTDRGLCGPCNNGINRMLDKESMDGQQIIVWGEKGCGGFEKSKHKNKVLYSAHPNMKSPLTFLEVSQLVAKVMQTECELYRIVYNKMSGPNSSEISEIWLPSLRSLDDEASRELLAPYEIEAVSADELLHNLNEFHLSSAVNYAVFQNLAVELFQRRNSMENANKNSKEVAHKIKLKYNKARQQMITTELGEIVSGAAAVDEMIKKS